MTRAKTPSTFPTHFKIILDHAEQSLLDDLWQAEPWWREPMELFHAVLRRGIGTMKEEAEENRDPHQPTRIELEATAASADGHTLGAVPHRCIEPYVAAPVSERTRQRLEDALSQTDLGEEELYEVLLNLGLDAVEKNEGSIVSAPVTRKIARRLAHQRRWHALCRKVASGWR